MTAFNETKNAGLRSILDRIGQGHTREERDALAENAQLTESELSQGDAETMARQALFRDIDYKTYRDHPLVVQFFRQLGNRKKNQEGLVENKLATQPWQAEANRLTFLGMLSDPSVTLEYPVPIRGSLQADVESRLSTFLTLYASKPFLWRRQIVEKADTLPIPRHTIPKDLLPYQTMLWTFEVVSVSQFSLADGSVYDVPEEAMLLHYVPKDKVVVSLLYRTGDPTTNKFSVVLAPMAEIHTGMTWPDDFDADQKPAVEIILRRLAFLNSPYVSHDTERLSRTGRRSLERANVEQPDPTIHVVKLRQAPIRSNANGNPGRDYKHQWWVRGHIRAQWYPSLKGHKLVWIREHLKGPSDAPIIQKVYDVQR